MGEHVALARTKFNRGKPRTAVVEEESGLGQPRVESSNSLRWSETLVRSNVSSPSRLFHRRKVTAVQQ